MSFWGGVVTQKTPLHYTPPHGFVLTVNIAALCADASADKQPHRLCVETGHDDGVRRKLVLCTLRPGRVEQQRLDLLFGWDVETTYSLDGGSGAVHLTGYLSAVEDPEADSSASAHHMRGPVSPMLNGFRGPSTAAAASARVAHLTTAAASAPQEAPSSATPRARKRPRVDSDTPTATAGAGASAGAGGGAATGTGGSAARQGATSGQSAPGSAAEKKRAKKLARRKKKAAAAAAAAKARGSA